MPRPRNLIPASPLEVSLPEDIRARLDLHLWSDLEQRVPHGAYKEFITERLREFFAADRLDIAAWAGSPPGAFVLFGPPEAIASLRRLLQTYIERSA